MVRVVKVVMEAWEVGGGVLEGAGWLCTVDNHLRMMGVGDLLVMTMMIKVIVFG